MGYFAVTVSTTDEAENTTFNFKARRSKIEQYIFILTVADDLGQEPIQRQKVRRSFDKCLASLMFVGHYLQGFEPSSIPERGVKVWSKLG